VGNAWAVLRGVTVPVLLVVGPGAVWGGGPADQGAGIAKRRAALTQRAAQGKQATPDLVRALDDDQVLVRRTAARLLARLHATEALDAALGNTDYLVRWIAVRALCARPNADPVPYLAKAVQDANVVVRREAARRLARIEPRTAKAVALLKVVRRDKDVSVRRIAGDALFAFYKKSVRLRNRPARDIDVETTPFIVLPKDGWRFKLDPGRTGHLEKWFDPTLDDTTWATIRIEQAWQQAGYKYIGVAWYRRAIDLPAKPKHEAVEIHFGGVDESAWVWVNGQYVGDQDIGPSGWNKPFSLDITQAVRWGQKNHITVRAMNTANAGGIWRPVRIEVLE